MKNHIHKEFISTEKYKELAQKTNLHQFTKNLFSKLDRLEQFEYLFAEADLIRQGLIEFHPILIEEVKQNELLRSLPLFFIKDYVSRIGATYLRWRNMNTIKSGKVAWQDILTDPKQPQILKEALVNAEKERILLNMQMAIIANIMRQLSECREKIEEVEKLSKVSGK